MERVLLRFTKDEAVRYVGHLDLMRVFERAMRRSGFPIAYSQGFNPRPRMAFASALTLGATSGGELCQLELAADLDEAHVVAAVSALVRQLPEGVRILDVWEIPMEKRNPYIQVKAAAYEVTLEGSAPDGDAASAVRQFFHQGAGLPQALESSLEPSAVQPGAWILEVTLPVGEKNGVRIRDLVAEIERAVPGLQVTRLHRSRIWCEQEPPPAGMLTMHGKSGVAGVAA